MKVIKAITTKSRVEHTIYSEIFFESNEHTIYVVIKDKKRAPAIKCPENFGQCFYETRRIICKRNCNC